MPGSLVRVVGAGSRGNKKSEEDAEHAVHWVFITYIEMDYLMNKLRSGNWKLHLHPGHACSDGITDDMIVTYHDRRVRVEVPVVVEDNDDGDLKPSASPPSALPPPRVMAAAASADSDESDSDESDEGWMEKHIK